MESNGQNPGITATITFDLATRQVSVSASTQDEMLLLYMFEKAKDAVKQWVAKQAEGQRIVPATAMPMIRTN